MEPEALMRLAIEQGRRAAADGEPPFGAIVVDSTGTVLAVASDGVRGARDMTRHAEIEAVRLAVSRRGPDLSGCTLVTNVEPCPMCFTSAWLSRISRIVYGATMTAVYEATGGAQREVNVPVERMNEMSGGEIEIVGGVLASICVGLFEPARPSATIRQ